MGAIEAVSRIHLAENAAQALERLVQATAAIGASASLYAVAIPEGDAETSSFSLFACDPWFAHELHNLGPVQSSPWLRFARAHTLPGTDAQVTPQCESEAFAVELARQHGFASCLIVPTPPGHRLLRVEMLCLGSDEPGRFEGDDSRFVRMFGHALAGELHAWSIRYLADRLKRFARLDVEDIELLALEWQGLCSKEIAAGTGLSIAAVDSRFQRLNARLSCRNRKASARRAAEYGVLEVPMG